MKKIGTFFLTIILLVMLLPAPIYASESEDETPDVYYYKGNVLRVETITYEQNKDLAFDEIIQISEIEILQGSFQGRVYTIENTVKYSDPQQIILHVGDNVMLSAELTEDGSEINTIHIYDYYRITHLLITAIVAFVLLLGITLLKGVRTAISIAIVALCLYFYFIPLMQVGNPAALLMIPICLVVMLINTMWDLGMNVRGFSAMIGTTCGIIIAAGSGYLIEITAKLIGLGETELSMLYYSSNHIALDYTGLFTAGVMLIAIGPIIDGCIDMVMEMNTLKENNPYISTKKLFIFGIKIGRGYMSRNVNTIFFVLLACMLPIWIVFDSYQTPFVQLINMDVLSIQLFRGLSATIGIVLSMPITALVYSKLSKRNSLY